MIILVNDELIAVKTTGEKSRFQTQFQSANKLIVGKNKNPRNQTIITARHPQEELDTNIPVAVRWTELKNGKGKMKASLFTATDRKGDMHSPVIIAAVPFNGILAPVEAVEGIRIHRAFIGKMPDKTSITVNDKKYRKVAFLVITPNITLFDPKNKNHVDNLTLNVVSYNYESSEGERKTIKQTFTIKYTLEQGDLSWACGKEHVTHNVGFNITWEDSEPVTNEDFGDKFLFPLYRPKKLFKKGPTQTNKTTNNCVQESKRGSRKPDEHLTQKLNLDQMLGNFDTQSKERQNALSKRSKSRQK